MVPKHKTFARGYAFSNFEGGPKAEIISIKVPETVTIPLKQGFGDEVGPLVTPGQKVMAGEIIGRDDKSVSSPVHSSVNGEVVEIKKIDYLGRETGAVVIKSDGTGDWQKLKGDSAVWQNLSAEETGELIYLSGVSSSGKAGIPTGFNSSVIAPEEVEDVIVQGVGAEVHNVSLDVLLKGGELSHFIDGLKMLKKVMAGAKFHIALDKSHKSLVDKLSQRFLADNSMNFFTVEPKYPVARDEVLIPLLLGKQFPYGYSAANIGAIVLDVQAVLGVYGAVAEGKPLIERTVALCGPGFKENPHVKLRLGTSLQQVVEGMVDTDKNSRFVVNSCLTGERIGDLALPVDRTFETIIAISERDEREFLFFARPGFKKDAYSNTCVSVLFEKGGNILQKNCETNVQGERRPCVFCTFCEEACPVGIIPHLLFHHVEKDIIDETLLKYKIFDCIDCNLCSYVCPSKIPLAEYIKEGKARLGDEGIECPVPNVALKGMEYKGAV